MRLIFDHIEIDDSWRPKSKLIFPLLKKELEFPWPIEYLVEFENLYTALLEPKPGCIYNENVFGVSKATGEIIWQIEPVMRPEVDSPFTGIIKKEDKMYVYNWSGYRYTVVPETGEILSQLFTK